LDKCFLFYKLDLFNLFFYVILTVDIKLNLPWDLLRQSS